MHQQHRAHASSPSTPVPADAASRAAADAAPRVATDALVPPVPAPVSAERRPAWPPVASSPGGSVEVGPRPGAGASLGAVSRPDGVATVPRGVPPSPDTASAVGSRVESSAVPTAEPTVPAWPALPTPPVPPPPPTGVGPSQPGTTDAREVARASLGAGRNPSLWWVCGGVVVCVLVTLLVGAAPGALVLSLVLAAGAVARATLRPGPVALSVRGRATDTAVLAALALAVGVLSQVFPTR